MTARLAGQLTLRHAYREVLPTRVAAIRVGRSIFDDGVFIDCMFKNCSLEYSGGDTYVQNCHGEDCQLVWRDAAQRTLDLLLGLG